MVGKEGGKGGHAHAQAGPRRGDEQAQEERLAQHPPTAVLDGQGHGPEVDLRHRSSAIAKWPPG
jgi:hypothetical protein